MVAVNYGLNQSRVFIGVLAGPGKPRNLRSGVTSCLGLQTAEAGVLFPAVVHCSGSFSDVESVSLQRCSRVGLVEPPAGARFCPSQETKCPGGSAHASAGSG